MHGHGDRPHLCHYPGCDRSIPGNGFPRRYNLFDHMKRVHDFKEEPTSSTGSPDVAGIDMQGPKRGGRKRKASSPTTSEPAAQRQRTMVLPPQQPQQPQVVHLPPSGYHQGPFHGHVQPQFVHAAPEQVRQRMQQRQRVIYSQWANQRELLARQMDFVTSPDDEANLSRLSQNIEELRRLSEEARRG